MKFNELSKWFNAVTRAWNEGSAPWAYPGNTSEAVRKWNELGDEGFVEWVKSKGVYPKKH
jgi:hypothetical protein